MDLIEGRMTANVKDVDEVVVFLIGMRINKFRAVRSWLPAMLAMPRMLRELEADRSDGLLGARVTLSGPRDTAVVQYWRSVEELMAYASAPDREHRPAWAAFNRQVRKSRGSVGIWHETYRVPRGGFESVYVDMPPYGLGEAYGPVPVGARGNSARERLAGGT
ncbi:DUF4188 domain-containing protein [Streptomyces albiaxialis]|uniref:DUF4188 domain-containing protein n=1 Tax=Streptomyces albiaxialis TaxID=329523 RepID=A0ABN2WU73_9ACTN